MNFVFAFLVYAVLFVAVGAEVPSNEPRVGGVAAGMPAEQAGLQAGDRVVAVDGKPDHHVGRAVADACAQSKGAPLALTVERDGAQLPLEVTPEAARRHDRSSARRRARST